MVVLLVEDMARTADFYGRLGLVFPADAAARRDIGIDIGDGRTFIFSTTFGANDLERVPPAGSSRIMLEFFVEGDAAVDAKVAELAAAGFFVRRAPWRTSFGAYMGLVDDPDGNTVLVTAG
jgi:catechol 2,3-dioxygenase-like lactoylglutathione lyase family enzyme